MDLQSFKLVKDTVTHYAFSLFAVFQSQFDLAIHYL